MPAALLVKRTIRRNNTKAMRTTRSTSTAREAASGASSMENPRVTNEPETAGCSKATKASGVGSPLKAMKEGRVLKSSKPSASATVKKVTTEEKPLNRAHEDEARTKGRIFLVLNFAKGTIRGKYVPSTG